MVKAMHRTEGGVDGLGEMCRSGTDMEGATYTPGRLRLHEEESKTPYATGWDSCQGVDAPGGQTVPPNGRRRSAISTARPLCPRLAA